MSSSSSTHLRSIPELWSLYEIIRLPQTRTNLQDYFNGVMAILSESFPISYSTLVFHDSKQGSLDVGACYGMKREVHPKGDDIKKGSIAKAIETQKPLVIQDLNQEPLYEGIMKGAKRAEKIQPPLLCIPLISDEGAIGVININPLYGSRNEFIEDFQFLSILSSILTPVIKNYQRKKEDPPHGSPKTKAKSPTLQEVLEERLKEVIDKIDPYVESKGKMTLLDDIVAIVERILVKSALEKMDHVQVSAAQLLGINRNTLRKKMKEFKIKPR